MEQTTEWHALSEIPTTFCENSIAIHQVITDQNYRKTISEESIADLATSIKQFGLLNPIIVIDLEDGQYLLCAGGRRIKALTALGQDTLPKATVYPKRALPFHRAMMYIDNFEREDVSLCDILDGLEDALYATDHQLTADRDAESIKHALDHIITEMGKFAGIPGRLMSIYSKLGQAYLLKNKRGAYTFKEFRTMIKDNGVTDPLSLYDIAIALLESVGTKRESSVVKKIKEIQKGQTQGALRSNASKLKKFAQGKIPRTGISRKEEPKPTEAEATKTPELKDKNRNQIPVRQAATLSHTQRRFEQCLTNIKGHLTEQDKATLANIEQHTKAMLTTIAQLLETTP